MGPEYLNTDLDLCASFDLSPIAENFGQSVDCLYIGERFDQQGATFEISMGGSPDAVINGFCSLVEAFEPDVKNMWDLCSSRVFDIGFESNSPGPHLTREIEASTIVRAAELNASIRITIYAHEEESR